ncbi:MAG: endonuclease/exonuclease/phosphatase family protein, partial [Aggregatilineales bacterium]
MTDTSPKSEERRLRYIIRQSLRNGFAIAGGTYGLVVSCLIVSALLTNEQLTPINLFVTTMPGILYPTIPVFLIAILLRTWRAIALNLTGILFFIVIYGGNFLPLTSPDVAPDFTVMTYNLKAASRDFAAHATLIREADVDIIALQEATRGAKAYFAEHLADIYPYQNETNLSRRLVLSRYPVLESSTGRGKKTDILYHRAVVDINGQPVTIFNTHIPL